MKQFPQFEVETTRGPEDRVQMRVLGEVDLRTGPEMQTALETELAAGRHVLLDLSHVEFMDSTGIGILVGAIQAAGANGWDLSIDTELSPAVDRLIHVSGLRPLLGTVAPGRGR